MAGVVEVVVEVAAVEVIAVVTTVDTTVDTTAKAIVVVMTADMTVEVMTVDMTADTIAEMTEGTTVATVMIIVEVMMPVAVVGVATGRSLASSFARMILPRYFPYIFNLSLVILTEEMIAPYDGRVSHLLAPIRMTCPDPPCRPAHASCLAPRCMSVVITIIMAFQLIRRYGGTEARGETLIGCLLIFVTLGHLLLAVLIDRRHLLQWAW